MFSFCQVSPRHLLAWFVMSFALTRHAAGQPSWRQDLATKLTPCLCTAHLRPLWACSVFDAQLKLKQATASASIEPGHKAYARIDCPDKATSWLAHTRAAENWQVAFHQGTMHLRMPSDRACANWSLAVAPLDHSASGYVQVRFKDRVQVPDGDHVLGVSCLPHKGSPTLYFLAARRAGAFLKDMNLQTKGFFPKAPTSEDFLAWVNHLRSQREQGPLTLSAPWTQLDQQLLGLTEPHLAHNRRQLLQAQSMLYSRSLVLLGENKAFARSLEQAARFWWWSPSHRQLLLHPHASHLSLMHDAKGQVWIALLARQQ